MKSFSVLSKSGIMACGLAVAALTANSQDQLTIDGVITVASGGNLYIGGDATLTTNTQLAIDNGEAITFTGPSFTAAQGAIISSGTGSISFSGSTPQTLSGGYTNITSQNTFPMLDVNNAAGITLTGATRVKTLGFTSGHLSIGSNDLNIAASGAITGADASQFVVTNGSGHLVAESISGTFTFPVGQAGGDYTPAILTPAGSNTFHVNVTDYANSASIEQGVDGVQRSWNIFADAATPGAAIALQHNSATNQSGFSASSNFVTQYGTAPNNTGDNPSQSGWQSNTPGGSTTNSGTETQSRTYTSLATSGSADEAFFSKTSNTGTPLPVGLTHFSVIGKGCNAVMSWTIASERNVGYYELQKSENGKDFEAIGKVYPSTGTTLAYSKMVEQRLSKMYYRLAVATIDKDVTYSATSACQVTCANAPTIIAAPNPVSDMLLMTGLHPGQAMSVIDVTGRRLAAFDVKSSFLTIKMSDYCAGMYTIVVEEAGRPSQVLKVLKSR